MGVYVTETGFKKKTLSESIAELEPVFQEAFGSDIDLDPDQPFGQVIGLLAARDESLWNALEEIHASRDPSQATGVSLDAIASETGVGRIGSGKTTVTGVLIQGLDTTPVPGTFRIKRKNGLTDFLINAASTIALTAARDAVLEPADPSAGGIAYTVTIDAVEYSYTSSPGDNENTVVDSLVSSITAGAWAGSASNLNGTLRLYLATADFNLSVTATLTLASLASAANFTAVDAGAFPAPANSLTEIVTPEPDIDSTVNPQAGATGRDVETNEDLRVRRDQSVFSGNATDEAIRTALLNRVAGIQSASVTSNRTLVTDIEGRPGKSVESVVVGGADADVAAVIWDTIASGIQPFGNTTVEVIDSEGQTQSISFSRPTARYAHVRVRRDLYAEETYPVNGDDAIKAAIVAWAADNQGVGVDVIPQRLSIPVYSVAGVAAIDITVDVTANPGDTPTYAADSISILNREYAAFAVDRIVVENLT